MARATWGCGAGLTGDLPACGGHCPIPGRIRRTGFRWQLSTAVLAKPLLEVRVRGRRDLPRF